MLSEVQCTVSGKVQRVGYRDFVVRSAKQQELVGFVQNKEDGTVVIHAQGTLDDLKEFVSRLNEGSVLAAVDSVGVDWVTPKTEYDDFEVRF